MQHVTQRAVKVCQPKTSEHRRAMRWFSSITRAFGDLAPEPVADDMSLQHSLQLYQVFAETGDDRYLQLSEDFLKYTLQGSPSPER